MTSFVNLVSRYYQVIQGWFRNRPWVNKSFNLIMVVCIIFIAVFNIQKDWGYLREIPQTFTIRPILWAFFVYGVNFFLFTGAWQFIARHFQLGNNFINNSWIFAFSQLTKILPTPAWFIGNRIVYYNNHGSAKHNVLFATGFEVLIHSLSGIAILLLLFIKPSNPLTWFFILPILLLLFFPQIIQVCTNRFKKPLFQIIFWEWLIILFATAMTWILANVFLYLIMLTFQLSSCCNMIQIWQMWIISSLIGYISTFTIGGGIAREFTFTFFLGQLIPFSMAVLISSMTRIIFMVGNVFWPLITMGVIFLLKKLTSNEG